MAEARIKAVITAEDRASAVVGGFSNKLTSSLGAITGVTVAAGLALDRLTGFLGGTLDAANKNQAALIGLSSVARAFRLNINDATGAAKSLAKDGLMTVSDAANGLKNLLQTGFSLPQAINIMTRFKDTAAFGRQGALSFGQAVVSATEGIRNGNSILSDNAGLTRNLGLLLEDAGISQQKLGQASTDASVRLALETGIMRESNAQVGDAARLAEQFAGKQAMASAQTEILKQQIGTALQAALLPFLRAITPLVQHLASWVEHHQKLAAAIAIGMVVMLALVAVVGVIAGAFAAVAGAVAAFGAGVVIAVGIAIAAIGAAAGFVITHLDSIRKAFTSLPDFIRNALAQVPQMILSAFGPLGTVINSVGQLKSGLGGLHLPSLKMPHFAGGVTNFSGGMAVVGERGPEIVNLPRGSSVIPNGQSGGTTINLSVNVGTFVGSEMEKRRLAEELFHAYSDLQSARGMA